MLSTNEASVVRDVVDFLSRNLICFPIDYLEKKIFFIFRNIINVCIVYTCVVYVLCVS